jgi:hypothetical protein
MVIHRLQHLGNHQWGMIATHQTMYSCIMQPIDDPKSYAIQCILLNHLGHRSTDQF